MFDPQRLESRTERGIRFANPSRHRDLKRATCAVDIRVGCNIDLGKIVRAGGQGFALDIGAPSVVSFKIENEIVYLLEVLKKRLPVPSCRAERLKCCNASVKKKRGGINIYKPSYSLAFPLHVIQVNQRSLRTFNINLPGDFHNIQLVQVSVWT